MVLSRFADSRIEAILRLKEFTLSQLETKMEAKEISKVFSQGIYGSSDFIKEITPSLICMQTEKKEKKAISLGEAVDHVCLKFSLDLNALSNSNKHKNIVDARSALALLARIGQQDWNLQDIALLLNKNHGSISRLVSRAKNEPELLSFVNLLLE